MKYNAAALFKQGLTGQQGWPQAWRSATLQPHYDAVVIGGGGHGLACAYYLRKIHAVPRVAVAAAICGPRP